jgi:iron complex transport system substrate-binding protein
LIATTWLHASAESPRIVSLAPSLTELVYALGFGDAMAGRSSACDYPPEVRSLPEVGGFGTPNLEALLRIKPAFVLITDLENPALAERIRSMGIEPLVLPCESWEQLLQAAVAISSAMGEPARGEAWVAGMRAKRAQLEADVAAQLTPGGLPRVYVEVWSDPLTAAGRESMLSDVVRLAGGTNMGDEIDQTYANVSAEWVVARNPDVIVLAYMTAQGIAPVESLKTRPGWSSIKAVQDGSICWEIPPELLTRPGPRILDGARALSECLFKLPARESRK